jgi:hypothetical protein
MYESLHASKQRSKQSSQPVLEQRPPDPDLADRAPRRVRGPLHQVEMAGAAVVVARAGRYAEKTIQRVKPASIRQPMKIADTIGDHGGDLRVAETVKTLAAERRQRRQPPLITGQKGPAAEEFRGGRIDTEGGDLRARRIAKCNDRCAARNDRRPSWRQAPHHAHDVRRHRASR